MATVEWILDRWLEENQITRYELAKTMGGNEKSRLTTLYRMRDPQRVDLKILADIIVALRSITGQEVTVNDLLEYTPNPAPLKLKEDSDKWFLLGMAEVLAEYERDIAPSAINTWMSSFTHEAEVCDAKSLNYRESTVVLIDVGGKVRPFAALAVTMELSAGNVESFWIISPLTLAEVPNDPSAIRLPRREGGLPVESTVLTRHYIPFSTSQLSAKTQIVLTRDEAFLIREGLTSGASEER